MINTEAFSKLSYGLFIVCSGDENKGNGFISNSVFQVTAEPAKFAVCCNKNNYTAELIKDKNAFSVSVLEQDASFEIIGKFGYKSGKDVDKMVDSKIKYGETGVPIVLNECIAYLECKVEQTVDAGTHLIFIGELVSAEVTDNVKEPLTYLYYTQVKKGIVPENSPTYIDKSKRVKKPKSESLKEYKCSVCGYIYDEAAENIKFEDLPDDWVCPLCGAEKDEFHVI